MLDMGEPVRIVDLAHDLIRLSGLEPDDDIDIVTPASARARSCSRSWSTTAKPSARPAMKKLWPSTAAASTSLPSRKRCDDWRSCWKQRRGRRTPWNSWWICCTKPSTDDPSARPLSPAVAAASAEARPAVAEAPADTPAVTPVPTPAPHVSGGR